MSDARDPSDGADGAQAAAGAAGGEAPTVNGADVAEAPAVNGADVAEAPTVNGADVAEAPAVPGPPPAGTAPRWPDRLIALALLVGYVALLLATVRDLGYARDEGFYFQAARSYQRWFLLLWDDPARALTREVVEQHWRANAEHPALMKSLFALSHHLFHTKLGWFAEGGTAFRFPGMVASGLGVAVTYLWGSRLVSRAAALVGALSLAFIPPLFYHAHLDCFDFPVATAWLVTSYAWWRSVTVASTRGAGSGDGAAGALAGRRKWGWAVATGLCYGLFLNTKHNAWIFPFAVVAHAVLSRGRALPGELRRGRLPLPAALWCMAVLGPLVLWATWPWLWSDPLKKLGGWGAFHLHHDYYNMEFLGQTYWKPPMPRLYAWVMTLATVPTVTLALGVAGLGLAAVRGFAELRSGGAGGDGAAQGDGGARGDGGAKGDGGAPSAAHAGAPSATRPGAPGYATALLWALSIAASYAPWLRDSTPIFGGTKHWITAYPFLCLFGAVAFQRVLDALAALRPGAPQAWARRVATPVLVAGATAGPVVMALDAHPWGLSAYVPLVGGAPGAATLGLNRGFWGYQTGALAPFINEHAPRNAVVYLHDTAQQSWDQLKEDGRVRKDLRGTLGVAGSSVGLYHHEQHMARVEHQLWVLYGTRAPAHLGLLHGVPIAWLYLAPTAQPTASPPGAARP